LFKKYICIAYCLNKIFVLSIVKKEHPKASHHCFAYRIGADGMTYRVTDAGEPSGTAGRPILGQIDSKGLTNTCVIVVRYFGGTLLGVPGLINAYKSAASLAWQHTPLSVLVFCWVPWRPC
jgi:putative IMPACT (imprinted ancient) family translation regulator